MHDGGTDSSARKRQKVEEGDGNMSSSRRIWRGNSREAQFEAGYRGGQEVNSFARSDSYYAYQGGDYYARDAAYEGTRRYGEWGDARSSSGWYDDYGTASSGWSGGAGQGYGEYYGGTAAVSRQYSDGGYGYPGVYRSSSTERLDRSAAPASAYYRGEGYYHSGRYPSGFDSFRSGSYSDGAQDLSANGARAGFRSNRFGITSPFRGGANGNGSANGRYANTFKARQYSFGTKKLIGKNATAVDKEKGTAGGPAGKAKVVEKVEPEKPRVITDPAVKDLLALRTLTLDHHVLMALLKLSLKPDPDLRKTLLEQKLAAQEVERKTQAEAERKAAREAAEEEARAQQQLQMEVEAKDTAPPAPSSATDKEPAGAKPMAGPLASDRGQQGAQGKSSVNAVATPRDSKTGDSSGQAEPKPVAPRPGAGEDNKRTNTATPRERAPPGARFEEQSPSVGSTPRANVANNRSINPSDINRGGRATVSGASTSEGNAGPFQQEAARRPQPASRSTSTAAGGPHVGPSAASGPLQGERTRGRSPTAEARQPAGLSRQDSAGGAPAGRERRGGERFDAPPRGGSRDVGGAGRSGTGAGAGAYGGYSQYPDYPEYGGGADRYAAAGGYDTARYTYDDGYGARGYYDGYGGGYGGYEAAGYGGGYDEYGQPYRQQAGGYYDGYGDSRAQGYGVARQGSQDSAQRGRPRSRSRSPGRAAAGGVVPGRPGSISRASSVVPEGNRLSRQSSSGGLVTGAADGVRELGEAEETSPPRAVPRSGGGGVYGARGETAGQQRGQAHGQYGRPTAGQSGQHGKPNGKSGPSGSAWEGPLRPTRS